LESQIIEKSLGASKPRGITRIEKSVKVTKAVARGRGALGACASPLQKHFLHFDQFFPLIILFVKC
jgi:hypothetical protein